MTFDYDTWLDSVDYLFNAAGCSRQDFPDWEWRIAFESHMSPKQAFTEWNEEAEHFQDAAI